MQDSWSTVLYMCKKSMDLLGTAGAWWLVAACVPGSLGCWCSLTGVMLAADGEAGSKCCDCCAVVPEFGRSQCYVVCERGCERERGVECKGRQSKNGGGYGGYTDRWMEVAAAISWVRWLSRPGCTALAVPASFSARRPVRVSTCSVELCDLWFTVHITKF